MPTTVPVSFRASPLPLNFKGGPQKLMDYIVARLAIVAQETIAFFVSGSVAPTSNVGPWLKDGVTWYVWDNTTASYVPEVIEAQSLRYIAQAPTSLSGTLTIVDGSNAVVGAGTAFNSLAVGQYISAAHETQAIATITDDTHLTTVAAWNHSISGAPYFGAPGAPDQTKYIFWIQLDSSGNAQSIRYYSGGAWRDVYSNAFAQLYTKSEVDAAIAAAVEDVSAGNGYFSAYTVTPQIIPATAAPTKILFDTVLFDQATNFNTILNAYAVPVTGVYFIKANLQLGTSASSSPTSISHTLAIFVNGISAGFTLDVEGTNTDGLTLEVNRVLSLSAGDQVTIGYDLSVGSGTMSITTDTNSGATVFQGYQIK